EDRGNATGVQDIPFATKTISQKQEPGDNQQSAQEESETQKRQRWHLLQRGLRGRKGRTPNKSCEEQRESRHECEERLSLRLAEGTTPQVGWPGLLHRGQRAFFIRIVVPSTLPIICGCL